ncbi:polysaccharide deacetylase family protein [Geminocystis sp. CENA526]|uniref:polysaccharide deacetylase family protein n=1 Tax=Geminocystis sp. CENA526 TaxID=1355871 RepID=UPI003D6E7623
MSDKHFKSLNFLFIFIASVTIGVVSAYIYTSDFFEKKEQKSSSNTVEKNIPENKIEPSEKENIIENKIDSNIVENQLETQEKIYSDYLNQGAFYFKSVTDNFSQINENIDELTGKNILENTKINLNNSQKFLEAIPPESRYYNYAQEYQKYIVQYQESAKKWEDYFNNKNRYQNQNILPPNSPDLTIKNKAVFVNAMKPKSIVLTFDDGPTSEYTIKILDILKKYNVKATFFVVGKRVQKNCPIIRRMYQEGHEIGNHSYTHPYLTKISIEEQQKEIAYTQQIIQQCIGYQPRWFRAPYGDQNPDLLNIVNRFGLKNAQWTIDTNDWRNSSNIKTITNLAINNNSPAVILMHDGAKTNPNFIHPEESLSRINTVNSLENIIINYQNRGFNFYTLSNAIK